MKIALLLLTASALFASGFQQDPPKPVELNTPKETVVVKAANIKWVDHAFVAGAKMCVLSGDPAKGPSVLMMKFPKGMTVPAHWHTSGETVTVVAGSGTFGSGETVDAAKGTALGAGSYIQIPSKNPHWMIVDEDLVISATLDKLADFHACGEAKK